MFRIDSLKETDSPEQSSDKPSSFEKATKPAEADKEKLERPEESKPKYSYVPEKADSSKEKLSDKTRSGRYHKNMERR